MNETIKRFFRQLRFWSFHCSFTALPSFLIAGIYLDFFQTAFTASAMIVGVLIFILSYTLLSTFVPHLCNRKSLFSRALHLALKIRIGFSVLGLFGVIISPIFIFHPDYWAGITAKLLLEYLYSSIFSLGYRYDLAESDNFLAILLWTLTEGVILSFFLFFISFFCLIGINAQQNRKLIPTEPSMPPEA